jgi:predicted GTPase|tara:strand:+ start:1330 stop:1662 length:333 start_codon:yes stop_codon:yes gene_type:complete
MGNTSMATKETQAVKLARLEADSTVRFDRLEVKIDKLAEALVALARVEEKMMAMEKNNQNQYERMNRFSQKLDEIEKKVDDNAHTVAIINKVVYLIGAAIVAGLVNYLWM